MIKLNLEQMIGIEQGCFYSNLDKFIVEKCANDKLLQLLSDKEKLHSIWSAVWGRARNMDKIDRVLFLLLLAVCECEGVAIKSAEAIADYISQEEAKALQFLSERGYFIAADFDSI